MQAHKKNPGTRRQLSVLIADDDVDTVLTLATMLRDEGHVVHTCANAKIVVEAIQRYKPDVCVLDIVMPGKTGFSIARDVYKLELPTRPILIALTGVFTGPDHDVIAKSAGFDYFVRKGSEPSELLHLINQFAVTGDPDAA